MEPETLPPLYDVLDPDHLEALIETADGSVTVEFRYCGYAMTVDGRGRVRIADEAADVSEVDA